MLDKKQLDLLLVNPGGRAQVYQSLESTLTAVEPPVWAGLIATFVRNHGFSVHILDSEAEELTADETAERIAEIDPVLTAIVIYGHQPSASTQHMPAAGAILNALEQGAPNLKVLLVGGHGAALPEQTLKEECTDFVCGGEGPYTIVDLLQALKSGSRDYSKVRDLWYWDGDAIRSNPPAPLIRDLDRKMPGMAWDLLPMQKYRAHNWHCFGDLQRQPYASLYTTLGCPYRCTFCCIQAPFKTGEMALGYKASVNSYRSWSPQSVVTQIDKLVKEYGIRNIKIADEMFVLNMKHVGAICDLITERGYDLNIWAYARVDTVKDEIIDKLKRAGFNWLAFGIEAASERVRNDVDKGFEQEKIFRTIEKVRAAGINVIGNFIFGLPEDDWETMQTTLDLALALNCEFANFYVTMAYPGSALYNIALKEGWPLPKSWSGYLESQDFSGIPQVSYRTKSGEVKVQHLEREFKRDLEAYPSPYIEGLYDDLIASQNENLEFQAIIETNRGCPFLCTFCYWGRGGLAHKYKYYDMDRVFAEIDWCGRNKIRYVFNADSNFGMNRRDLDIAHFIVDTKKKYGRPEKFRTCFGKNTDERIFQIGSLFHKHDLEKGITLARQSNDEQTLKNIRRANIKMSTYRNLQVLFNNENVPVYSEFILGLPGETVESWKRGIDEMIEAGVKNQCFVYLCQVLANTEMADPAYQEKFGIKTKRIELAEIHGSVRDVNWLPEYEDIIITTNSMNLQDWRRMIIFSHVFMVLHGMKTGYFVMIYLLDRYGIKPSDLISFIAEDLSGNMGSVWRAEIAEYNRIIDGMLERGHHRGTVMPDSGEIYWDVEEASFLRIAENLDQFYRELYEILVAFLSEREIAFDPEELRDVVRYQQARIPARYPPTETEHGFAFNLPEYFDTAFSSAPVPLRPVRQVLHVHPVDFAGDKEQFARETILWGRKSGTMLVKATYQRTPVLPASDKLMVKVS